MVKHIVAIDPGTTESAIVVWNGSEIIRAVKVPNDDVFEEIDWISPYAYLVIEMVASYGMAVGKEVFETCVWIGRFYQFWESKTHMPTPSLVVRKEVKMHLCGQTRAKDSNIRQALVDRFGDKGTKAKKGLTYGLKADTWQAFALAVTCFDKPELMWGTQLTDGVKPTKKITIKKK